SRVVERLLAKNPSERIASADEVAKALAPFAVGCDLPALLRKSSDRGATKPLPVFTAAPRKTRPRWPWLVGGLLAVAVAVLAGIVISVQTDKGSLEIVCEDDDIKVGVERGGKEITVLDRKTNRQAVLDSGDYELKIVQGGAGAELVKNRFTLKRGDKE